MFLIGLTGGIATGKSLVSKIFQDYGIPVVDADAIARVVVEPGKPAWKKIKKEFGKQIILENNQIDRNALGAIVFKDKDKRKKLNSFTHGEIFKLMLWSCFQHFITGHQCLALEIPLLYETRRFLPLLKYVVVVTCNREQQIERLQSRNNLTVEEAEDRINSQLSLETKCKLADFVIDNSKSIEHTEKQIGCIIQDIRQSKAEWKIRIVLLASLSCVTTLFVWAFLL